MKKLVAILIVLCLVIVGIVGLKIVGRSSSKDYLKANSTQWSVAVSKDGRHRVVLYRFPRMKDAPEALGLGQGFARLEEVATGKVLAEKDAEDLAALNTFSWTSNKVVIADFVEWELPQ